MPPGAILAATIYEGEYARHERPGHLFTQEIEVGLPHRFGLALEVSPEIFRGRSQIRNVSIEARYAFADWNRIPLKRKSGWRPTAGFADRGREWGGSRKV